MTTTIQAQVSQATLSKVSRLFNASLTDCFNELLQNARRAGASVVIVTLTRDCQLVIMDDGVGIANPQTLLTLGKSDWSSEIQQQEDPAGMGIFSLANRNVLIRSHNWQVQLTPAHFAGEAIAVVEPCEMISGTRLSFRVEEAETSSFNRKIEQIAKFYPLPVWLNGEEISRQAFLSEALYVENWQGLRIGIRQKYQWGSTASINFYGLILDQALPSLCCNGETLLGRVDVVDCPQLKLVLPARKETVQDEFWSNLTIEVQRILYRYVATLDHHDLSHLQWQKAKSLGIELSVARAILDGFVPETANSYDVDRGIPMMITERTLLINIGDLACGEQQVFWRAFQQAKLDYEPVNPNQDYVGYPWYDRLACLSNVRFEIEQGGTVVEIQQWCVGRSSGSSESVDQIWAIAQITDSLLNSQEIRFACEVLLVEDPEEYCDHKVEQTPIVLSQSANLSVDDLAELLEAAYFSFNEDYDANSLYTQQEDFREIAYERAAKALLTDQAAFQSRIEMVAARHLSWMVPLSQKLEIRLVPRGVDDPVMSVEMRATD
jgi:hypothetical protein